MAVGQNRTKRGVVLEKQFQLYCFWKSLPPTLKGRAANQFDVLGIEDETTRELLLIRTQAGFGKKYGVNKNTLTEWNAKIETDNIVIAKEKKWLKKLFSNVLVAVYRKALVEGDAARFKVLAQYIGEFTEAKETRSPKLAELTSDMRKILERR
ncbi:MAG: hypothetical protein Q7R98_01070 [Candidatus Jorgensenbacteria bacterium]|nr:hypothetical protein [Candidatus Jorgensenbacteria bacterium]